MFSYLWFTRLSFCFSIQGLDEKDEEKKMENLYVGQGVGADPEEEGDDDEDEVDGNVSPRVRVRVTNARRRLEEGIILIQLSHRRGEEDGGWLVNDKYEWF